LNADAGREQLVAKLLGAPMQRGAGHAGAAPVPIAFEEHRAQRDDLRVQRAERTVKIEIAVELGHLVARLTNPGAVALALRDGIEQRRRDLPSKRPVERGRVTSAAVATSDG